MKLEEYIAHRKTEDGINELNLDERAENTKVCVNYVFEYFNNYLDSIGGSEEMILHNQKIDKYRNIVKEYSPDVKAWLVELYAAHGKYMHHNIGKMIEEDKYFLLYDSEKDFRALSYDLYPKAIKKYGFLEGQSEMFYRFIKDYHRVSSLMKDEIDISPSINKWVQDTYAERGVNLATFCENYLSEFFDHPERWPRSHKKKSEYGEKYNLKPNDTLYWDYDYRQKNNLFQLDSLYSGMPQKYFLKRRKQYFEILLMYEWLHSIDGDEEYWIEYINVVNLDKDV